MTDTPSRRPGRPDYQPTDAQRERVKTLKGDKATRAAIARDLGISPTTLNKYFAAELGATPAAPPQLDFGGEAHKAAPVGPSAPIDDAIDDDGEHQVTDEKRRKVRLWALHDWEEPRMARQLGISVAELRQHYMPEIEYGADFVATQTMLDLERQSREGKTAASRSLLEYYKVVAPLRPPTAAPEDEPAPEGIKARRNAEALVAHQDTDWDNLMGKAPAAQNRH